MEHKRLFTRVWVLGVLLIVAAALANRPMDLHPVEAQSPSDVAAPWDPRTGPQRSYTPAQPPDSYTGTHVVIRYTDCANDATADCISATRAQLLAQQLDDAWEAFVDYGFNEPYAGGGTRLPVWVFEPLVDDALGWARGDHIEVRPDRIQTSATDVHRGTPHHELFHQVQRTYADGEPAWVKEGTPKFIEDMVFDDLDANASSQYVARVNRYLGAPNMMGWDDVADVAVPGGLFDTSYNAALIWKYLTEQFGDISDPYFGDEPQYGIDFLVDYWDESETRNGIDAVNAALPSGVSFDRVFEDFLIANYLKRFGVSAAYRYVDDPGPTWAYRNVYVEYGTESLPLSHTGERVEDWGANYYVGAPGGTCPFVHVTLDGEPGSQAFYAIFATRGNDAFYYDHTGFRTFANDFTKTLYNNNYDTVVAVVGGLHNPAEYDVSMSCVSPSLEIVVPRTDLFAEVGDPNQPRRMMVYLELTGAGDSFVEGVTWEEFGVSVGGRPVDDVVTGAYVQSQYWLIVQPPTQTVTGDPPWIFDLDVSLESLNDHEDNAVHYRPLPHYDEVLVVDTSGSMNSPPGYTKLLAAQNAAKLYLDELADGDKVGAVEFNTEATRLWNGMTTVNDLTRGLGKLIIDGLTSGGCTSIGGGLQMGLAQFDDPVYPGDTDNPDVMVLLSDGMENTSPCWEYHPPSTCPTPPYHDCSTGPYVQDEIVDSGIPVNTVALGPGSHEDLLERIAEDTGGIYRFATLPTALAAETGQDHPASSGSEPPQGAPQAPSQGNEWAYRLAAIYDFFEGEVEGRERILVDEVTIPDEFGGWYETTIYLDPTVSQATFSITYDQFSELDGSCTTLRHVQLEAPDDALYDPNYSSGYHDVFEISSPVPGNWVVRVEMFDELCRAAGPEQPQAPALAPYHYQVIVSGQTDLATEVHVGTPHADRYIGLCVPIFATFLGQSGPVQNGFLTAEVTTPSGDQIPILLSDEGTQGDGAPEDGIYGGRFCRDATHGSYTIDVAGRVEAIGGTIRRLATVSFYVQDDDDDDGDGLPNRWELVHGLESSVADDDGNPDLDFGCILGCSAWTNDNELQYGTDPNNDDTDGGGEMDFSEILWGQDPSGGAEDDMVEVPTSFVVTPGTEENVITYDARPGDDTYWLFWSTDPQMGDMLETDHRLDIGASGYYTHTGLTNGTTYHYLLVALRQTHISGFADQVSATPALDPTPPQGTVLIDDNAMRAASYDVTLTLYATEDTEDMLIANTVDFDGAAWEPFADTRSWRIISTPEQVAFVYARFRDAAGNVSDVAIDGILLPHGIYLPLIDRSE